MNTHQTTNRPTQMKPNTPAEGVSHCYPSVEDGLRALQRVLNDIMLTREEEKNITNQLDALDSKYERRADAELRRWKSFARDAWSAACAIPDTAIGKLNGLNSNYGDLITELRNDPDDDQDTLF